MLLKYVIKKAETPISAFCGLYWIRTSDPYPVKVML